MLQEYLAELSKVRRLSAEEEKSLWCAFKEEGKRDSRLRLIESYQPLVFRTAVRMAGNEVLCAELIQEGTLGLIEAVEGYEPERAVRFSTYAQHHIRGRMLDFLRRAAHLASLAQESVEGGVNEPLALVRDERVDIEEEVGRAALRELLLAALERLTQRERQIVRGIYLHERTPREVASELGISPSYLYKAQKRALRRLRGLLARNRTELRMLG